MTKSKPYIRLFCLGPGPHLVSTRSYIKELKAAAKKHSNFKGEAE